MIVCFAPARFIPRGRAGQVKKLNENVKDVMSESFKENAMAYLVTQALGAWPLTLPAHDMVSLFTPCRSRGVPLIELNFFADSIRNGR